MIWARISPAGHVTVWTLAYAAPARIARTRAAKSPGGSPCTVGPTTLAGWIVPVTVPPPAGHAGVPAGPFPRFVQRNAETPCALKRFPKWMCDCVAADESPLYV